MTLPTGEIRDAGVYNKVLNWLNNSDYGLLIGNASDIIYQSDLQNLTIILIKWTA